MGIWARIIEPLKRKSLSEETAKGFLLGAMPATSGVSVTAGSALQCAAVYGCVRVLAESVAQLPLILYGRDGRKRVRAVEHPLYSLLHDAPNEFQTSFEWREMMMGHVLLRGNAYSFIGRTGNGRISELLPIHPDRVEVKQADDYTLTYEVTLADGSKRPYPREAIFHLKGLSSNGFSGISPISMAREPIGLALAAEYHGARLFANGARPGGILKHPGKIGAEAAKRLKESWHDTTGGANVHKVALLEEGMEWHQLGMTSEDAQFLETRAFQIEEIARIFRVPTILLQHADKSSTYASSEQFFLSFVIHSLMPWLKRWEQAIRRDLIADRRNYFPEFLVEGLLRGDAASRAAFYREQFMIGAMSQNEIRAAENRDPIEDGDRYYVPLNMVPTDQVDQISKDAISAAETNS